LRLLEAPPPDESRILAEIERRRKDRNLYSSLLYLLAHLSFSEVEARRHWERVSQHRRRLRRKLGRDLGLRVALLDYFVNLNRELKNPKVIEIAIYERTARSAVTDGLTGLYNHAYFLQALRREIQRCRRHDLKVSLALFDLDDFKKLNDTRGHPEGDRVLAKAASLIKGNLREIDTSARYGGEEFAAILPETSRTGAYVVADRTRARIEEHFKRRRGAARITVSGGVASFPDDASSAEELIRRADEGLYRSKAEGKNRITLAKGERRRHRRVPAQTTVTLSAREGRVAAARALNVSAGGLLVTLKDAVPVGSRVSLTIGSANGGAKSRPLRGRVVRVTPAGGASRRRFDVGVRLLDDPGQARKLLPLAPKKPAARRG
jgi:diguanylate cyclase (GGDEF)-like protein